MSQASAEYGMQWAEPIVFDTGGPLGAYDRLVEPINAASNTGGISFLPNPAYEQYLRMHKVFVGQGGADQLQDIYESLCQEELPRYLSAAGWAATEAALVYTTMPEADRLDLLHAGVQCWERAIDYQKRLNADGPDCLVEYAYPHRIALDMAVVPLLEGVITGNLTAEVRKDVFKDCLNIAQSNSVQINLMAKNGHLEGLAEHLGFGYECNALLAFNWRCSKGWFVIPSMARSDTGYHHRQQTHDLMVVHHRNGQLLNITPVEIKASASARDRERYKALLVRGKMHLSAEGGYTPEATLKAIEAVYENNATPQQLHTFNNVTERFIDMVRDYCAGEALGYIATMRSVTRFRDNSLVTANHPGLVKQMAG
jgi:hypothetical protein